MSRSRLSNNLERKAIHNILIVLFGFIIVVVIVVMFGYKLLVEFSLLSEKMQGNSSNSSASANQQDNSYIAPPTLNPAATATNSAQITISGFAQKNQTVNLYLNDQMTDTASADSNGKFKFSSVTLQQGQNTITAKAADSNNKESTASNEITISYSKSAPGLSIDKPQDGQTFSKSSSPTLGIQGKTDIGNNVTVNGFWAIVDDQGNYNYLYTLQNGDNDIKVVATDPAGNQTTKEIHIHAQ
jgi:bacillopeptidase F